MTMTVISRYLANFRFIHAYISIPNRGNSVKRPIQRTEILVNQTVRFEWVLDVLFCAKDEVAHTCHYVHAPNDEKVHSKKLAIAVNQLRGGRK
jgi:hypothetical protein